MTEPATGHAYLDELAAGYALHALGQGDQRRFAAHLPNCHRCQDAVSEYAEVAAALAETGLGHHHPAPSAALRDRVLAAVTGRPDLPADRTPVSPLLSGLPEAPPLAPGQAISPLTPGRRTASPLAPGRHRGPRRRSRALLAAAAAAVILAGGGVAWDSLAAPGPAAGPPAADCAATGQCRELTLASAVTGRPAATIMVQGGVAWLVPAGLPADQPTRQVYVLWQLTGASAAHAIGAFDVTGRSRQPIRIGSLPDSYQATRAFAVSLEPGHSIPPSPSTPVAVATITATARS